MERVASSAVTAASASDSRPVMSTASTITRRYEQPPEDDPPLLEWDDWPIAHEPFTVAVFLMALAATSLGAWMVTARLLWTFLADALIVLSFLRALLPATYRMGPQGVERTVFGRLHRIPWQTVRAVRIGDRGVFLLDTTRFSPVDALRAVFVPFGPYREAVLARLEYYLARRGESQW